MNIFKIPKFMLTDEIVINELDLNTSEGETYGSDQTFKVRFEPYREKATDSNGEEILIRGRVFMNELNDFPIGSKVTFDNRLYYIWRKDRQKAIDSYSHQELILRCR